MAAGGGTKATMAALTANLTIAVLEFVAYILTVSSSMLAEAILRGRPGEPGTAPRGR
jgi:divalent metal cation (Fe/Co/Zn/Cd) transporter